MLVWLLCKAGRKRENKEKYSLGGFEDLLETYFFRCGGRPDQIEQQYIWKQIRCLQPIFTTYSSCPAAYSPFLPLTDTSQ